MNNFNFNESTWMSFLSNRVLPLYTFAKNPWMWEEMNQKNCHYEKQNLKIKKFKNKKCESSIAMKRN